MNVKKKTSALHHWQRFWMRFAGTTKIGKFATTLATWGTPPHYSREVLARIRNNSYISTKASIFHNDLQLTNKVFIDDHCLVYKNTGGGYIKIDDRVRIYRNTILENGKGGNIHIGEKSSIHPRCQINAYHADVVIGKQVMIAANCALYSYDHGTKLNIPIHEQAVSTKGPITIHDEAWIGTGAIILSGVTIGRGAVVGAGSVVTKDIPKNGIAIGNPAKVVKYRT